MGLVLGFSSYNYTFYLLLTWVPSYLSNALHVDLLHSVFYPSVPWLVGTNTGFSLRGGRDNFLIHKGWNASRVQHTMQSRGTNLGQATAGAPGEQPPANDE